MTLFWQEAKRLRAPGRLLNDSCDVESFSRDAAPTVRGPSRWHRLVPANKHADGERQTDHNLPRRTRRGPWSTPCPQEPSFPSCISPGPSRQSQGRQPTLERFQGRGRAHTQAHEKDDRFSRDVRSLSASHGRQSKLAEERGWRR